ncbi:MAG: transglycosylase domain-containing protein, partial [Nitrospirales bacterium]
MLKDAIRNWSTGIRKLPDIAAGRVETLRARGRRAAARIGGWIPPYRTVARLVLWPVLLTGIASFAMLAGYGGYVFTTLELPQADDDPPLLIYGAPFPLRSGLNITSAHLQERLDRLGYTAVMEEPRQPGEYRLAEDALDLYLRDYPEGHVRATRLRLPLDEGRVIEVRALPQDEPAMFASLEPPLVAGMVGADRQVREWIPLSNIPDHVVRAVLDMEDRRFYHHVGVDPFAVARALWTNVSEGQVVQGGSTITQQLAKNLFFSHERTFLRKAKESLAALMLELKYDKDRILECYLNEIYL